MMRWLVAAVGCVLAVWIGGCSLYLGDDGGDDRGGDVGCVWRGAHHVAGDLFPAGDGCNVCSCDGRGGVSCTQRGCPDAGVDAPPGLDAAPVCAPSSGCPYGPACNMQCCAAGEHCEGGACMCGGGPACQNGDVCTAGGPVGGDTCGIICCGDSTLCPL